jgi:hypothetical protein
VRVRVKKVLEPEVKVQARVWVKVRSVPTVCKKIIWTLLIAIGYPKIIGPLHIFIQ